MRLLAITRTPFAASLCVGTLLFAGCAADETAEAVDVTTSESVAEPAGAVPALWDHEWQLVLIDMMDGEDLMPVESSEPYVSFSEEANPTGSRLMSGSTGCNQFNGAYDAGRGGRLAVSDGIAMTRMACGEAVGQVEVVFMLGLEGASGYEISDTTLSIEFGGGTLHFAAMDAGPEGHP